MTQGCDLRHPKDCYYWTKKESGCKRGSACCYLHNEEKEFKFLETIKIDEQESSFVKPKVKDMFACKKCNRKFKHNDTLEQHITLTHKNNFYGKIITYDGWENETEKSTDNNEVFEEEIGYHYCDQCDLKDSQNENILKHSDIEHKSNVHKCDFCEFQTENKDGLIKHEKVVHQAKNFPCNICNYKTIQKISLQYHMKSIHNDKTCITCIECKPNKKIQTNELFECFDCEEYCCQTCKNTIKFQKEVQKYLKLEFEPHQFICSKCMKTRFKTRYDEMIKRKETLYF